MAENAGGSASAVSALVVDLADMSCFEAVARDLNRKGCWIVSEKVDLLKKEVGLRLDGFDKLLRGQVISYGDNEAQISFQIDRAETGEKRREIRRRVLITCNVCGRTTPVSQECRIVDASKSGCRLEGDKLNRLPRDIDIFIPSLDLPIAARIVWRRRDQAGVRLNWPFEQSPEPEADLEAATEAVREQAPSVEPARRRNLRKRISAFGR
ncbi:PilZ domain-containing protein [Roseibium aggregatum]|uniref:PilZ domain-containing protein n=1 Tax=Roseibium aggregatum TaxID=187304 RepID=A0A939EBS1_9HYPH|nr:PilZ domain-containing protein [Roseibium aggregatum]MBN9669173.1 PilZ domain-containing protein [Roseibium aggregatum]